jgi:hypothetical protein
MGMTQKERDQRRHGKAARLQEEDLRLKVRPGTKQALTELMQWAGIEEQGEALTLMIHHLHRIGPERALEMLQLPPRYKYVPSHSVALAFERKSLLMIQQDPGDEIVSPKAMHLHITTQ